MIVSDHFLAQGAIPKQTFVKWGSVEQSVTASTAVTDRIIGVHVGPGDAIDGATVEVCLFGRTSLLVSGAIGRGMSLTTSATGLGINAAPSSGMANKVGAIALQSGTSILIPVFVIPHWYTAPPLTATATLNFPSIAAGTVEVLTMTVTGAAVGDAVLLGPPSTIDASLMWSGFVSATNTISVRVYNPTGAPIDPASSAWRATAIRAT